MYKKQLCDPILRIVQIIQNVIPTTFCHSVGIFLHAWIILNMEEDPYWMTRIMGVILISVWFNGTRKLPEL